MSSHRREQADAKQVGYGGHPPIVYNYEIIALSAVVKNLELYIDCSLD